MSDSDVYPEALKRLTGFLRRLPGVGRRTAERLALALLEWSEEDLQAFGGEIAALRQTIRPCPRCGSYTDRDLCAVCRSPNRATDTICVVETAAQIPVIESAGCYRGLYHVLGGRLMPLKGKGPEDLRIAELLERVTDGDVRELIIATSPDVEGEATAHFIAAEVEDLPVTVTRIAAGVPVGSDLSYADAATMAMAIGGRRALE